MTRVRTHNFSISLDGFGAGPLQTLENPLGVGGKTLHEWFYPTRTFRNMLGKSDGATGTDDDFAARYGAGVGAFIMGRNMFGPVRGAWPDDTWRGWWGNNPPYHAPVFVLTHHVRAPIHMEGGTVFHFVTGGARDALDRATEAAQGKDVQVSGGAATIRQYLQAKLIDELHFAISPTLLGSGEPLFRGLDLKALGYECTAHVPTAAATHVVLTRC
jgi:dihydrofolate reductase